MKKIIILFLFAIFLIAGLNNVLAAEFDININMKDKFVQGEVINFDYTIISNINGNIEYYSGIKCDDMPLALIDIKKKNVSVGEIITGEETGMIVDKYYGNCFAYVNVLSPIETKTEKTFEISAPSEFDFELETCRDKDCGEKSKIFIINENIYLDYKSDVENPIVNAVLTYPDGTNKQITLPYSIIASQIGTYKIDALASKEGYITMTKNELFGVIEQNADIETIPYESLKGKDYTLYIAIGLVILIIAIIIVILRYYKPKKNKKR